MADDFRFVIVGSGNMSRTYVRAIRNVPGARLVGVVSRSGRRPAGVAQDDAVEVASSISAIRRPFDAVILATPNGVHHQGAIEAAALGRHVLTEKPLDITIEAMDAMIAACRRARVKLGVTYQRRMSPDNIAVKRLLDQKRLGRVYAADVTVKFYRPQSYYDFPTYKGTWSIEGGGAFMQQASHNVDIYCWFFGMPVKVASVWRALAHRLEAEDHGAALLLHGDGMIGTMIASTLCKPGFSARLDIHAEAGSVVMENDIITRWAVEGVDNPGHGAAMRVHNGATSVAVEDTQAHEAILADFIRAVREDREPAVTGESARMATELILQIYRNNMA
jgi:predicted dehydrogenase